MKCRRDGCEETVLSWLDPEFCSDPCRTSAGRKRTGGIGPAAAPLVDEPGPVSLALPTTVVVDATDPGPVRGHHPDLVIIDEIHTFMREPQPKRSWRRVVLRAWRRSR